MDKDIVKKALDELKQLPKKKFNQTVDLIVVLKGLNLKKPDDQLDFYHLLHHNPGKEVKIGGFVGAELLDQSKEIQREIGKRNYKNKKGIHGMTFEQRSKRSKNTYAQGKGIGGITTEQRREIGKKSGQYHVENKTGFLSLSEEEKKQARLKGLAALGYTPWIDQEREDVYLLSQKSEYRFGKRANLKLIKKDINKKYHGGKEIRSIKSLANELCRYKKIHA